MVRMTDIPAIESEHLLAKRCPKLPGDPWVSTRALSSRRVALITTAGLGRRDDTAFGFQDVAYKVIPDDVDPGDVVMTHVSVNFDRSGFQDDINVAFPLDRLHELVEQGAVGSAAMYHYSFMGALSEPEEYESTARELAARLRDDNVDTVFITPV